MAIVVLTAWVRLTDSEVYPLMTGITEFEKIMLDSAPDGASRMFHDEMIDGFLHLSWADYCEIYDPHFYEPKAPVAGVAAATAVAGAGAGSIAAVAATATAAIFNLDESLGAAQDRQDEYLSWQAVPRDKRKPFTLGGVSAGNCKNKEDTIVVKGLPSKGAETLFGDLRAYLGEMAVIVDLYKPAKGPLFIGVQRSCDIKRILDAHAGGLLYKGSILTFERAMSRSKTSTEMATRVSV
jgi:hypothetical protein